MGLRKGNVEVNVADAVGETPPPFKPDEVQAAPAPAPQAAPAPAPAPTQTAPVAQEQAAAIVAAQAAPAPAPVAVDNPPTQVPATRTPAATALAPSGVGGALEESGFHGLDFGFGSFPMITLQNDGTYQSSEGGSLGSDFYCILLGSTPKWIYKNDQKGPAEDFFYTFDREFSVQGEPIDDILAGWKQKGWDHEVKKYLDVQAQLVTDDDDNGTIVLLSVPPTSITKFSGYAATVAGRHKRNLSAVITHVTLGDKVTKVKYPFHPWAFSFHGDAAQ